MEKQNFNKIKRKVRNVLLKDILVPQSQATWTHSWELIKYVIKCLINYKCNKVYGEYGK